MGTRNLRKFILAACVVVVLILTMGVQIAAASSIHTVTVLGEKPGIIDLTIASVGFDKTSGIVTVTGSVGCATPLDLLFVDFAAVQNRGRATLRGFSTVAPSCAGRFTASVESDTTFAAGPVVIQATAIACASDGGCAGEVLQISAVLIPREHTSNSVHGPR